MIRLYVPFVDDREVAEVAKVLATGYLTQGPKVAEFEREMARLLGCRYAFAMSSCTTALHLALVALGIGPGDEVLVSDLTFPATANVVVQQGARPVLVDVRLDTYNMDVGDLATRVTPKSRAIIPVHAFGLAADMDGIMEVARRHRLAVIEDAACALMARYRGRMCGTIGDMGCFSFHPRKSITTGEGGMIVTDDDRLARRVALLRSHGGVRGEFYFHFEEAGFNYRLSDVQAAIGVAQLAKLDWIIARKRELAAQLKARLASIPEVTPPVEPDGYFHSYQSYVIMLEDGLDRDRVIAAMRRRGVETTLGTYALHAQPFFQRAYGYTPGELPNSYHIFRQSLTLPFYPQMTAKEMEQVLTALQESLEEVRSQPRRNR
ncbi:MAG: DegT/DnrJ/EryC1/StrS family aminotransferase [Chloroflexia bacterium]